MQHRRDAAHRRALDLLNLPRLIGLEYRSTMTFPWVAPLTQDKEHFIQTPERLREVLFWQQKENGGAHGTNNGEEKRTD
jgi:hypothetical protein